MYAFHIHTCMYTFHIHACVCVVWILLLVQAEAYSMCKNLGLFKEDLAERKVYTPATPLYVCMYVCLHIYTVSRNKCMYSSVHGIGHVRVFCAYSRFSACVPHDFTKWMRTFLRVQISHSYFYYTPKLEWAIPDDNGQIKMVNPNQDWWPNQDLCSEPTHFLNSLHIISHACSKAMLASYLSVCMLASYLSVCIGWRAGLSSGMAHSGFEV
jgi:hypothetical protein